MDNPQETPLCEWERAWLAGILDGEGYIGLTNAGRVRHDKPHFRGAICIANTDADIIAEIVRIIRKLGIEPYIQNKAKVEGQRPAMLVWVKNFAGVLTVLAWSAKYLRGQKRFQAQIVCDFISSRLTKTTETYSAGEMELIAKSLTLNKRGSSQTTRDASLLIREEMKI